MKINEDHDTPYYTQTYADLKVHMIPCRTDNYSFVLEGKNKKAIMIDSSLKEPVWTFLKNRNIDLQGIFLTHHHYDHVDKVKDFQQEYGCKIFCSELDSKRPDIKGETTVISEGTPLKILDLEIDVVETPGHTKSHLTYYIKNHNLLFCGDTLFSLGCGRVFETYETVYQDFYSSMQKIKNVCNNETKIYCAHEYTAANLNFLNSQNLADKTLATKIVDKIKTDFKTIPSDFLFELKNNPFLNAKSKKDFEIIRKKKDNF